MKDESGDLLRCEITETDGPSRTARRYAVRVDPEQLSLVSLIYSSDATAPLEQDDLDQLVEHSRINNAERGLTGMLLYRDKRFLQVLEGSFVAVHALMDHLQTDERHSNVRVLLEEPILQRQFADWSMGFSRVENDDASDIPGYRRSYESAENRSASGTDRSETSTASTRALNELMRWFERPDGT